MAPAESHVASRASSLLRARYFLLAFLLVVGILTVVFAGNPRQGMAHLVTLPAVVSVLASALVLLLPGWMAASLLRFSRVVPAALMPTTAIVSSVVLITPLIIVQLARAWNIQWLLVMYAGLTLVLGIGMLIRRARRGLSCSVPAVAASAIFNARSWWRELASTTHPLARYSAVAAALLGCFIGALIAGDAWYHAAQALKLSTLANPDFNNTLQFPDGTSHPGYQVPVWQSVLALIAHIAHVHPAMVMWLIPILLTPAAVLAAAGAAEVLLGSRVIGGFAGMAWLGVNVIQSLPYAYGIRQGPYPRQVVTDLAIPLVIVAFAIAVTALQRSTRMRALLLMAIAQSMVLVVHVSYVFLVGMMILGYMIVWAVSGVVERWPRWREHLIAGTALAAVTIGGFLLLAPYLAKLQSFMDDATTAIHPESTAIDAPTGTRLGELFVGTPHHYHLRADYLVWIGGFSLLGLCATLAFVTVRRSIGGKLFLGTTGIMLVAALSDRVFPHLVDAVGAGQAKRLWLLVPAVPALAFVMFLLAARLDDLWARNKRGIAGVVWLAITLLVAATAVRYPIMTDPTKPFIPHGFVSGFALVFLIAAALGLAAICTRLVRRAPMRWTVPQLDPASMRVRDGAVAAVVCALLVGAAPHYLTLAKLVRKGTIYRPADIVWYSSHIKHFTQMLVTELQRQPAGTIVMAPPETAYIAMGVAPIYVASSEPGHTANTAGNRLVERYNDVNAFYSLNISDAKRMQLLRKYNAKLVIAGRMQWSARVFLRRYPDVFIQQTNGRLKAWKVVPSRLASAAPADAPTNR